jgi:hypothetical protein
VLLVAFVSLFAFATCGGSGDVWDGEDLDPFCQTRPEECPGQIGLLCVVEDDCDDGVCCLTGDATARCAPTCVDATPIARRAWAVTTDILLLLLQPE